MEFAVQSRDVEQQCGVGRSNEQWSSQQSTGLTKIYEAPTTLNITFIQD